MSRKPLVVAFVSDVADAIRGTKKLGDSIDDVAKSTDNVEDNFKESEKALRSLGIKSEAVANKQIEALRDKFKKVEEAGVAGSDEIARAQKSMELKIKRINDSIGRDTTRTWDKITSRVKAGIGSIGRTALRGGAIAAGVGVAAGAATFSAVSAEAGRQDDLIKLSRTVGIDVGSLSELQFAAEQAGVDVETFKKGLIELQKSGSTDVELDFRNNIEELSGIEDEALRASKAIEVFGTRYGPEFASLIAGGTAGLEDAADRLRRFGGVVNEATAEQAEAFNDRFDDIKKRLTGIRSDISGPFFQAFAEAFEGIGGFIDRNRDSIIAFGQVVAEKVLAVINDIIAILEGNESGVQNQWVLNLINLVTGLGNAFSGANDFLGPLSQGLSFLYDLIYKMLTPVRILFDTLKGIAEFTGTAISTVANIGEVSRAENAALAYRDSQEFKDFQAAQGTPVNINIGDKTFPATTTRDVADDLARNQQVIEGLRPTNVSRNY